MSTITIIQGNNNDKDNTRAYMVKGEKGVSPIVSATKEGTTATITVTDFEGTDTVTVEDGISPTVETSKENGVTTVTITDYAGTHTATINDGEVSEAELQAGLATKSDINHNHDDRYYTKAESNTVQTDSVLLTSTDMTVELVFRRCGNIVQVIAYATLKANNSVGGVLGIFAMPDIAKSTNFYPIQMNGFTSGTVLTAEYKVYLQDAVRVTIMRNSSNEYFITANYSIATVQSSDKTIVLNTCYIVD